MKGAIVGFGSMGKLHLQCYKKLGVEITSVVDPLQENCLKNISEIPSDVDFIDICSPSYLHFQHLQQVVKFQKPIFVEKPLVIEQSEVDTLRKLRYNKTIFVGEVELYNACLEPFFNYKKQPKHIRISRRVNLDFFLKNSVPWFLDSKLSGGIVMDLMIHDLTLLILKYNKPTVEKVVFSSKKYGVPDNVSAVLKFPTFTAVVEASWIGTDIAKPIKLEFKIDDLKLNCDNYVDLTSTASPYYRELDAFIASIKEKKSISLLPFLEAVETCLEINKRLN